MACYIHGYTFYLFLFSRKWKHHTLNQYLNVFLMGSIKFLFLFSVSAQLSSSWWCDWCPPLSSVVVPSQSLLSEEGCHWFNVVFHSEVFILYVTDNVTRCYIDIMRLLQQLPVACRLGRPECEQEHTVD